MHSTHAVQNTTVAQPRRCITADPNDLVAWSNAAMAELKLERWQDAARSSAHVVLHSPPEAPLHVKALYRQGLAYVHMGGRLHEAKRTVEALRRISPKDAAKVGGWFSFSFRLQKVARLVLILSALPPGCFHHSWRGSLHN